MKKFIAKLFDIKLKDLGLEHFPVILNTNSGRIVKYTGMVNLTGMNKEQKKKAMDLHIGAYVSMFDELGFVKKVEEIKDGKTYCKTEISVVKYE